MDAALFGGDSDVSELWEEWIVGVPPEQWSKIRDAMDRQEAAASNGERGSFSARLDAAMASGMSPEDLEAYIAKLRAENARG